MIAIYILLSILGGCLLFIAGIFTGVYIVRRTREVITREVEKIVPVDRVVEVEKPIVVQIPAPRQTSPAQLPVIGAHPKPFIADPAQRAEAERITSLLDKEAEA